MMKPDLMVGRYRLQPGNGLLAGGVPVTLGAKALDILTALVEAAGELVTKDELLGRVWPGLIVEEHNIQVHISALRKALGDDADWIQTVPRLGYRFVGPSGGAPPAASLPRPLNRLFGREGDLATIRSLLDRSRLVTLVGPGGIGKTRVGLELAREIAGRYRDGAAFVDFSVLQDPSPVSSLLATALGIPLNGDRMAEQLARRLKERELLILLDNCEHVVEAMAPLAEIILAGAPGVRLLATSREPLACLGEQIYRLPLLPVPADATSLAEEALMSPAVALLVDRLEAADLRFKLTDASARAASAICRRLDGLPLAIEMVGAFAPGLGLEALAAKLEQPFSLPYSVTRTIAPRHRSLEATLDWSHALLSPAERTMLRRLAVFPGPFSLEAVEAILGGEELPGSACGDLLVGLVRKSLVSADSAAAPLSYRLLETIRAYAAEKLEEADEHRALRGRHARYVADIFNRAMREWNDMADSVWRGRYAWLLADLRAALNWSFGPDGDIALGLVLAGLSRPIWHMLNLNGEGRRWAEAAAAEMTEDTDARVAAFVWAALATLTARRSFENAISAWRKAVELFGRTDEAAELGAAMNGLAQMLITSGQTEAGAEVLVAAKDRVDGHASNRRLGNLSATRGLLHSARGSWSEARREFEQALILLQAAGADRLMTATSYNLADMLWAEGSIDRAVATFRETVDLARRNGPRRLIGLASGSLSGLFTVRGDLGEALVAAREAVAILREEELTDWLFPHLALSAAKAGRPEVAAQLLGYAERTIEKGVVRQRNERRAIETLQAMLHASMPTEQCQELIMAGRYLSEDQAIALALAPRAGETSRPLV